MERRFTVWAGGFEVNDRYLTKEEADELAAQYKDKNYDDIVVEEMKGSIKASDFVEWYYSDESDTKDAGEDIKFNIKTNGYYNLTVKELFDSCGYIPEHICESFNEVHEEDFIEYEPNDLIFIDDITQIKECHKCHTKYTGDLDFCTNCGTCVS